MSWPVKNYLCKSKPVKPGRGAPFLKCADAKKNQESQKKSGKYDTTKETKKAPITNAEKNEDLWTLKEYRIILLRKFNELQENTNN